MPARTSPILKKLNRIENKISQEKPKSWLEQVKLFLEIVFLAGPLLFTIYIFLFYLTKTHYIPFLKSGYSLLNVFFLGCVFGVSFLLFLYVLFGPSFLYIIRKLHSSRSTKDSEIKETKKCFSKIKKYFSKIKKCFSKITIFEFYLLLVPLFLLLIIFVGIITAPKLETIDKLLLSAFIIITPIITSCISIKLYENYMTKEKDLRILIKFSLIISAFLIGYVIFVGIIIERDIAWYPLKKINFYGEFEVCFKDKALFDKIQKKCQCNKTNNKTKCITSQIYNGFGSIILECKTSNETAFIEIPSSEIHLIAPKSSQKSPPFNNKLIKKIILTILVVFFIFNSVLYVILYINNKHEMQTFAKFLEESSFS